MDVLNYLLLVNIYLVLFYAFYALFLKDETFFKLNRFYLVGGAAMSFLIPFLQSDWIRSLFITRQVEEVTQNITFVFSGPQVVIQAEETSWGASEILLLIYLSGAAFFLLRFLWQLYRVQAILKSGETGHALSFFHKVKVGTEVPNRDTVLDHEMVHARQWHSADVILFEIISIIAWFNPVVYLYRKAIKHIHEFTADEIAANNEESKTAYAMLLVSKTFGIPSHQLTNSFYNQSLLKRRIIMLHKSKSTRNALLKYGLSAPLFAGMMILSSATVSNKIESMDESILASNVVEDVAFSGVTNKGTEDTAITNPADIKPEVSKYLDRSSVDSRTDTVPKISFTQVEVSPEPSGGFQSFYDFIGENFKYTQAAKEKSLAGKIILQFVVEPDGTLSEIRILRGLGSGLDEEAVRVLSQAPSWKPGIKNGKAVRVAYTLPMTVKAPAPKTSSIGVNTSDGKLSVTGANKDVLYVLDGKIVNAEVISSLPAKSVKAVNVLKGEQATTIYGQKGKDGVIEVYVAKATPANINSATTSGGINELPKAEEKLYSLDEVILNGNDADSSPAKGSIKSGAFHGLVIVDGKEAANNDGGAVSRIKPNDIESINVIKDKEAIKEYGERGRNGVLQIKLKKN